MSQFQRNTAYYLYVLGLFTALTWCGAQAFRALTTTQGASLAQYVAFTSGFIVQLVLALKTRKEKPGPIIDQQIKVFKTWSVCGGLLILVVAAISVAKGGYRWSEVDTMITVLASGGLVATVAWATLTSRAVNDAAVQGWFNIVLKSLPQFLLAWKVLAEGPAGITWIAVVMGNFSIISRLVPMTMSWFSEGKSREKGWLIVTDAVNLASWLSVTACVIR